MSGIYELFLKRKQELFLNRIDTCDPKNYFDIIPDEANVKECFRIFNANHQRKYNNWNEICKWLFAIKEIKTFQNYKLIFGTLTFTDKVLQNTNERTRRRYVAKFLGTQTYHYVANIDFGNKNNREHYHFIAMIEKNINMQQWTYGANNVKLIKMSKKDIKATKNYLLKLNNHSYKESTRLKRIIRDRNKNNYIDLYATKFANFSFHQFKIEMSLFET